MSLNPTRRTQHVPHNAFTLQADVLGDEKQHGKKKCTLKILVCVFSFKSATRLIQFKIAFSGE